MICSISKLIAARLYQNHGPDHPIPIQLEWELFEPAEKLQATQFHSVMKCLFIFSIQGVFWCWRLVHHWEPRGSYSSKEILHMREMQQRWTLRASCQGSPLMYPSEKGLAQVRRKRGAFISEDERSIKEGTLEHVQGTVRGLLVSWLPNKIRAVESSCSSFIIKERFCGTCYGMRFGKWAETCSGIKHNW